MYDDTLTDHEFAEALRESQAESFAKLERAEPDLRVDGLSQSLLSRMFALLLPRGRA